MFLSTFLLVSCGFALSSPVLAFTPLSWRTMESPSSCISTASSSGGNSARNMWNPLLDLLLHVQINDVFVPFNDDIDLARVALSCHFALDLLCFKELDSPHPAPLPDASSFSFVHGTFATTGSLVFRAPANPESCVKCDLFLFFWDVLLAVHDWSTT